MRSCIFLRLHAASANIQDVPTTECPFLCPRLRQLSTPYPNGWRLSTRYKVTCSGTRKRDALWQRFHLFLLMSVSLWKLFFHIKHSDKSPHVQSTLSMSTNPPARLDIKPRFRKGLKIIAAVSYGTITGERAFSRRTVMWKMYKNLVSVYSKTLKLFIK